MNVNELHANRGWDRQDLSVDKLAQLAWSMKETGWEAAHPVIYEEMPDGIKQILWGHRRTLAYVLAQKTEAESVDELANEIKGMCGSEIEFEICPECGEEIPSREFENCPSCDAYLYNDDDVRITEASMVSLINTNLLVQNYDDIIHSAGDIEIPAIERPYVDELTSQLTLVQDGLGREDADIIGLSHALHRAVYELGGTTAGIEKFGLSRNEVQGLLAVAQMPVDVAQLISDGAASLTVARLIFELTDSNKRQAMLGIVLRQKGMTVSEASARIKRIRDFEIRPRSMLDSPKNQNLALIRSAFFDQLLRDGPVELWTAVSNGASLSIPNNIVDLVEEVSCDKCALKGRMKELPKINAGNTYPCQTKDDEAWCQYCDPEGRVVADYTVRSKADIEFTGEYAPEFYFSSIDAAKAAYDALKVPETEAAEAEGDNRPIDLQRAKIKAFIGIHAGLNGASHPWATHCESCGFHTEGSPVKSDPDAPPCVWGSRRTSIRMGALTDGKYTIPLCHQYSPVASVSDIIPESNPGATPREILNNIYDQLLSAMERAGVPALTFITGVPFSASERHTDWLRNRVAETGLTDGQMNTLVQWLSAEVNLVHNEAAPIQLPAGKVGRFTYKEL